MLGLAGCNTVSNVDDAATDDTGTSGSDAGDGTGTQSDSPDFAVAAEWNAMRARVWDADSLGLAGAFGAGAAVAQSTFARFESAGGEYGAHEMLEHTSETAYEEFEEALGELRTEGLRAGDAERTREEATIASTQISEVQRALVGESAAEALDLQLLGANALNAAALAAVGNFDGATATADAVYAQFEDADAHDALESADGETYEAFEHAVEGVAEAAADEDADTARTEASAAYEAAIDGSYALADAEAAASAGHLATLQARGWDAAALGRLSGPSTDFAHAVALTLYRARAADCQWLAARGGTDRAAAMAGDIFAHFEEARAQEALEHADETAYEGFESGLSDLRSAIEDGDSAGVEAAVATVDESLRTGIEALAGANTPLLGAAYFRARLADARELSRLGDSPGAATAARDLFERFESNRLDLHESMESTSEDLYHAFEEEHLSALITTLETEADDDAATHFEGAQSALLEFETSAGTTATVSGAEAASLSARGFDAAALAALGDTERAAAIARTGFEHFESGAGGYHEALERADESAYERFEERLGAVRTAADDGGDVYAASKSFAESALHSAYVVVESAGGETGGAAASVLEDAFAHFEGARVHDALEDADHEAYETFEAELDAYVGALRDGGDVRAAAESFADATLRAQFAVAGAVDASPVEPGEGSDSEGTEGDGESELSGGPNVVDGVPDAVDHVVEMQAVAFEPAGLTVSKGDTVAWKHTAGEAHTVTAREDSLPAGADYWSTGDVDSESAAVEGWENGSGAVQSGQAFVHTFETAGTYEYYCVPHEAAGMEGSVTVE